MTGHWSVVSGQLKVESGWWTVDGGPWSDSGIHHFAVHHFANYFSARATSESPVLDFDIRIWAAGR